MFKVVHKESKEEIIILAPEWSAKIEELRRLGKSGGLLCPGCKQPVIVRAGEIKQWHFAHRHLQNCSYGKESVLLLNARAVLYRWLVSKFEAGVTVEKTLATANLPRYVDCWVETKGRNIAYWIFDGGINPDRRDQIVNTFRDNKIRVNFVFIAAMLRSDESNSKLLNLTKTERRFLRTSEYDAPFGRYGAVGKSLHYLDPDSETLITYRGLHLIHDPQQFEGKRESHSLLDVLVSPKTGEFVHPGEHERLGAHRKDERQREAKEKIIKRQQNRLHTSQRPVSRTSPSRQIKIPQTRPQVTIVPSPKEVEESLPDSSYSPSGQREAVCIFCGETTSNWWSFDPTNNTCKCKSCFKKGLY